MADSSKLDIARAFDEGWQKGYRAACEHPLAVANTETDYLRARLREAEAIICCVHLDFRKEAYEDATEYMREHGLTDSGPLA